MHVATYIPVQVGTELHGESVERRRLRIQLCESNEPMQHVVPMLQHVAISVPTSVYPKLQAYTAIVEVLETM